MLNAKREKQRQDRKLVKGTSLLSCSPKFDEDEGPDYGEPLGLAKETAPDSGVFVREWSKCTVQMDCNSYTPKITFKK